MFKKIIFLFLGFLVFGFTGRIFAAAEINLTPSADATRSFDPKPHWNPPGNSPQRSDLYVKSVLGSDGVNHDQVFAVDVATRTEVQLTFSNITKVYPDSSGYFTSLIYDANGDNILDNSASPLTNTFAILFSAEIAPHTSRPCDQGCNWFLKPIGGSFDPATLAVNAANEATYPEIPLTFTTATDGTDSYIKPHLNPGFNPDQTIIITGVRQNDTTSNGTDKVYTLTTFPLQLMQSMITLNNVTYRYSGNFCSVALTLPAYDTDDPQWSPNGGAIFHTVRDGTGFFQIGAVHRDETFDPVANATAHYACGSDPATVTTLPLTSARIYTSSSYEHGAPQITSEPSFQDTNGNQYPIVFDLRNSGSRYSLAGFTAYQDLSGGDYNDQFVSWGAETALSAWDINRLRPTVTNHDTTMSKSTSFWAAYQRENTAGFMEIWAFQASLPSLVILTSHTDFESMHTGVVVTRSATKATAKATAVASKTASLSVKSKEELSFNLKLSGLNTPLYVMKNKKNPTMARQMFKNMESGKVKYQKTEVTYEGKKAALYSVKSLDKTLKTPRDPKSIMLLVLPEESKNPFISQKAKSRSLTTPSSMAMVGTKVMAMVSPHYATDREIQYTTDGCGDNDLFPHFYPLSNTGTDFVTSERFAPTDLVYGQQEMYPTANLTHSIFHISNTTGTSVDDATYGYEECGGGEPDSCEELGYMTYDTSIDLYDSAGNIIDTNGNGIPDRCEGCLEIGGLPTGYLYDTDGDGVNDSCTPPSVEDCISAGGTDYNPTESATEDRDGDGTANRCDACPDDPSTIVYTVDTNADGVADACTTGDDCCCECEECCGCGGDTYNYYYYTYNYYYGGDTCTANGTPDSSGSTALTSAQDADGDGRRDAPLSDGTVCDICPAVSNTDQLDSDGDGFGDACDICPEFANPLQVTTDSDGDGTPDECQVPPDIIDDCVAGTTYESVSLSTSLSDLIWLTNAKAGDSRTFSNGTTYLMKEDGYYYEVDSNGNETGNYLSVSKDVVDEQYQLAISASTTTDAAKSADSSALTAAGECVVQAVSAGGGYGMWGQGCGCDMTHVSPLTREHLIIGMLALLFFILPILILRRRMLEK